MKNTENTISLESSIYRLYELRTQISKGVEEYKKAIEKYEVQIKAVEDKELTEELKEFYESCKEAVEQLKVETPKLENRLAYLNILIERYEKQDEASKDLDAVISMVFAALGIRFGEPEIN